MHAESLVHVSIHSAIYFSFFFNDTATTEIYTLSLHDALPILRSVALSAMSYTTGHPVTFVQGSSETPTWDGAHGSALRSEEHTSELQSRLHLVCRLLLEKKKPLFHMRISLTPCRYDVS